ncbi:MAG: homocysteine S-methyltransferase family protein [Oscillospiraceae bacterium]|nr:homocysteine S-methyltransferase family protein [Oscillospiraceae bacterium]
MQLGSGGNVVIYDGAIGTMLLEPGRAAGERPDMLCMKEPGAVENLHRMYAEAGSEIIVTNTFGANAKALAGTGYAPGEIIAAAVALARRGGGEAVKVALDIGPLGYLLEPLGDMKYEAAYELFKEQALAGEAAGADYAAIETMSDLPELEAAIIAIKENTGLPVLATMTFDRTGHTFTGCTPESLAEAAGRLGAAAVGLNCSLAPAEMYSTAERIAKNTDLPLIVKPNAGLPDSKTGLYSIGPDEFARQMAPFVELGAAIIGGCCGTTPEHIRQLRRSFKQ